MCVRAIRSKMDLRSSTETSDDKTSAETRTRETKHHHKKDGAPVTCGGDHHRQHERDSLREGGCIDQREFAESLRRAFRENHTRLLGCVQASTNTHSGCSPTIESRTIRSLMPRERPYDQTQATATSRECALNHVSHWPFRSSGLRRSRNRRCALYRKNISPRARMLIVIELGNVGLA